MCLIMGRPVVVHESRQGGQVAEPLSADQSLSNIVDLTNRNTLETVIAERLTQPGRKLRC